MKIRHPWLIKLLSFLGYIAIRMWLATLRVRMRNFHVVFDPERPRRSPPFILAFWHDALLMPAHFMGPAYRILISQHADGELIAQICRLARAGTIRGSATRGGIEATRQLLRAGKERHLVVVPDGPRGPRREVKPGIVFLAARTGLPIVAAGFGHDRPWRLRTWDRFLLPFPGRCVCIVVLEPIYVPADADKDELEAYRRLVEEQMHRATRLAERWVETGSWSAALAAERLRPSFGHDDATETRASLASKTLRRRSA
jgi:lysophospholipid acyltransferase (LPLAT)-like uncharacterized protein